jgi:hypothetical protein
MLNTRVKTEVFVYLSFECHRYEHVWTFGYAKCVTTMVVCRRLMCPIATHEHIASKRINCLYKWSLNLGPLNFNYIFFQIIENSGFRHLLKIGELNYKCRFSTSIKFLPTRSFQKYVLESPQITQSRLCEKINTQMLDYPY